MNNKLRNLTICILLGMSGVTLAANANNINKLDLKRSVSSASTLNMTIFTDNPYDENVAVTKKSDNKYVILMPNLSGSTSTNVDFSSIKDVVSDVNVRTVEDGGNGYTKVTVTTTKPVAITTSTRKSAPLTEEQRAYKNLIGQAKGYAITDPLADYKPPVTSPAKTETVAAKSKSETVKTVSDKSTSSQKSKAQSSDVKPAVVPTAQIRPQTVISQVKNIISSSEIGKNNSEVKSENKSVSSDVKNKTVKEEKQSTKLSNASLEGAGQKDSTLKELREDVIKESKQKGSSQVVETSAADSQSGEAVNSDSSSNITDKRGTNKDMGSTLSIIILAALAGLFGFFKLIKKSIDNSVVLKQSFNENLSVQEPKVITPNYADISVEEELSWQEKYQRFLNSAEEINPSEGTLKHIGNGEYEFVNSAALEPEQSEKIFKQGYTAPVSGYAHKKSNLKPKSKNDSKLKSYNKPAMNSSPKEVPPIKKVKNQNLQPTSAPKLEIVENKYDAAAYKELEASLERTLHNSPSEERTDLMNDLMIKPVQNNSPVVHREEDSISNSIRKSPKLKAFANKVALEQTRRNIPMPKNSSEIIKSRTVESKYVNLEHSGLYSSERKFTNANLSASDLISRRRIDMASSSTAAKISVNDGKYSTVSVDEFFDAIDSSSRVTAPASLSSRVADSLVKISSGYNKSGSGMNNNSSGLRPDMNVVSSYRIDDTSGFYIVADKGEAYSLVGKVGQNMTTLKTFSNLPNAKLQVRQDEQNVYMVRVGADRFLVEMNENKIGVLLEL